MDGSRAYVLLVPTALSSLRRPGRVISMSHTTSSGRSVVERWSEGGLFMYLAAMWRDIQDTPPGPDSSGDTRTKENVERLLLEWLTICSVDMERLH